LRRTLVPMLFVQQTIIHPIIFCKSNGREDVLLIKKSS